MGRRSKKCVDRCIVGSWVAKNELAALQFVTYGNMNIHADGTVIHSDLVHNRQPVQPFLANGISSTPNMGLWTKVGHRHYRIVLQSAAAQPDLCSTGLCGETPVNNLVLDNATINRSKIVIDLHVSEDCQTATGVFNAATYDKDDVTFTGPSVPAPPGTFTLQRFHLY